MKEGILKKKIGVLAGGPSREREISLKSGSAVFSALKGMGLKAVLIDVQPENFSDAIGSSGIDIAFIALHGMFGEDGRVQGLLEEKGIPYTGSGPDPSRRALDKIASKKVFCDAGLTVPEYRVIQRDDLWEQDEFLLPCVVKPQFEGSSIGLTIVTEHSQLRPAMEEAFECGDKAVVEKFISGREITVGILESSPLEIVEIRPEGGVYDFKAKYRSSATEYIVPAELDNTVALEAKEAALRSHEALGCKGVSRADFMLDAAGGLYILEVNTIPGMTERSLLPMAAKAAGIGFDDLCLRIVEDAIT